MIVSGEIGDILSTNLAPLAGTIANEKVPILDYGMSPFSVWDGDGNAAGWSFRQDNSLALVYGTGLWMRTRVAGALPNDWVSCGRFLSAFSLDARYRIRLYAMMNPYDDYQVYDGMVELQFDIYQDGQRIQNNVRWLMVQGPSTRVHSISVLANTGYVPVGSFETLGNWVPTTIHPLELTLDFASRRILGVSAMFHNFLVDQEMAVAPSASSCNYIQTEILLRAGSFAQPVEAAFGPLIVERLT